MEILRDPLWQSIGALFALVAITISLIVYFLQRQKKRLNYEKHKFPLLSFEDIFEGKLKIYYKDIPVTNVYAVIVGFSNTGNQPITSQDYEKKLSIVFGKNTKILSYSVLITEPEYLDVKIEPDDNKLIVSPLLLNPKDSFKIRVIISEIENKFNLDYRIIGIKRIVEGFPNTIPRGYLIIGAAVFIVGMILNLTNKGNLSSVSFDNIQGLAAVVLILFGLILSMGYSLIELFDLNKSQKVRIDFRDLTLSQGVSKEENNITNSSNRPT